MTEQLIGRRFRLNNVNYELHGREGTILGYSVIDNNHVVVRFDNSIWGLAFKISDLILL